MGRRHRRVKVRSEARVAAPVLTLLFLSYVMFVLSGTALIIATALAFLLVLRVALDVRDLRREPPSRPPPSQPS